MEKVSVISLSRLGVRTSEWSEVPDCESLQELSTPITLGVLYESDSVLSSAKVITDKETLVKYYNKLRHAYGADTPIIAMSIYDDKGAMSLVIDKDNYELVGMQQDTDVLKIKNLSDILLTIRRNVIRDFGKVDLKCILEPDSNIRVIGTC